MLHCNKIAQRRSSAATDCKATGSTRKSRGDKLRGGKFREETPKKGKRRRQTPHIEDTPFIPRRNIFLHRNMICASAGRPLSGKGHFLPAQMFGNRKIS